MYVISDVVIFGYLLNFVKFFIYIVKCLYFIFSISKKFKVFIYDVNISFFLFKPVGTRVMINN